LLTKTVESIHGIVYGFPSHFHGRFSEEWFLLLLEFESLSLSGIVPECDVVQNIRSRLGFGLELQAGQRVLATSILTANPGPLSREPTLDGVGSAPHHGGARYPQQPAQVVAHLTSPLLHAWTPMKTSVLCHDTLLAHDEPYLGA
jgi:hypothetical protein